MIYKLIKSWYNYCWAFCNMLLLQPHKQGGRLPCSFQMKLDLPSCSCVLFNFFPIFSELYRMQQSCRSYKQSIWKLNYQLMRNKYVLSVCLFTRCPSMDICETWYIWSVGVGGLLEMKSGLVFSWHQKCAICIFSFVTLITYNNSRFWFLKEPFVCRVL